MLISGIAFPNNLDWFRVVVSLEESRHPGYCHWTMRDMELKVLTKGGHSDDPLSIGVLEMYKSQNEYSREWESSSVYSTLQKERLPHGYFIHNLWNGAPRSAPAIRRCKLSSSYFFETPRGLGVSLGLFIAPATIQAT